MTALPSARSITDCLRLGPTVMVIHCEPSRRSAGRATGRGIALGRAALFTGNSSPTGARDKFGPACRRGRHRRWRSIVHTHIGGERNRRSFEQNLRAVLLGHLHRGFALGEYLIKFLTAEQLEGEGYVAS